MHLYKENSIALEAHMFGYSDKGGGCSTGALCVYRCKALS